MSSTRQAAGYVLLAALGTALVPATAWADQDDLLDYCVANSDSCALSVLAIDEGWERHQNADRPQVLASTYKILILLAYAQAVADGAVSPDDLVDKEDWARFFSGGSTLATSWDQLGSPDRIRLDDLARVMILNSDNSAPDLFAELLKKQRLKKAVKLFGWHDLPAAISAMFGLWQNLNGIGGTGNRVAGDYGGFEAAGYQKELSRHTRSLRKAAFVETVRTSMCQQPPWEPGEPPCDLPQPATTASNTRTLENRHFNRGTTRAYAALMRGLLDGNLLSAEAHEVVDRALDEAWLERFPTLTPAFSRYGLKGGSLATSEGPEILTWAHYMEAGGGRYVVVVFLRDMSNTRRVPDASDVNAFAQQFALNADFRRRVRDAFDPAAQPPELAPQLKKIKSSGSTVTVKAKVYNTSPVSSGRPVDVVLYLLDDTDVDGAAPMDTVRVGAIKGYSSKGVTLKATADGKAAGKLAVLVIDSGEDLAEQDEANNLTWQRLD